MKKKLLLLFLLISGVSFSQISITFSDFSKAFGPGSTYLSYMTPLGGPDVSVFVGEASATAQYWDFTNYTFEYMGKSVGIDPSTAPFITEFPSANYVLKEKGWYLGPDTFYIFNYKELQSDRLLLLGLSSDSSVQIIYDPPAIQAMVPLTYGVSWTRSGSVVVDAFGTMKLPSGEYECLRLRWDYMKIKKTPGSPDDTIYSRSFIFYSKEVREVNVLNIPPEQFNLTTVTVMGFSFSDREGNAGIQEKKTASLGQNFPNPFNSQTVIRYDLASCDKVILKIYDFLGKEVATPLNEVQTPGNHEVVFYNQGLSPGVYYYQLTCGDFSVTKKMVISR